MKAKNALMLNTVYETKRRGNGSWYLLKHSRCLWSEVVRFCWVRLPHSLPSRTVLPGVQEIVGCPPSTSSLCRLPTRSEFPLTLWLRWSYFVKGGWGRTYHANKTREVQVLSAGSKMNTCLLEKGVGMGYYKTDYHFVMKTKLSTTLNFNLRGRAKQARDLSHALGMPLITNDFKLKIHMNTINNNHMPTDDIKIAKKISDLFLAL